MSQSNKVQVRLVSETSHEVFQNKCTDLFNSRFQLVSYNPVSSERGVIHNAMFVLEPAQNNQGYGVDIEKIIESINGGSDGFGMNIEQILSEEENNDN